MRKLAIVLFCIHHNRQMESPCSVFFVSINRFRKMASSVNQMLKVDGWVRRGARSASGRAPTKEYFTCMYHWVLLGCHFHACFGALCPILPILLHPQGSFFSLFPFLSFHTSAGSVRSWVDRSDYPIKSRFHHPFDRVGIRVCWIHGGKRF